MQLNPLGAVHMAMLLLMAGSVISLLLSGNRRPAGWFSFLVTAAAGGLTLWASAVTIMQGPGEPVVLTIFRSGDRRCGFTSTDWAQCSSGSLPWCSMLAAFYSISYMDHYSDYHVAGIIRGFSSLSRECTAS